jgi:hypothetical protein
MRSLATLGMLVLGRVAGRLDAAVRVRKRSRPTDGVKLGCLSNDELDWM